jgi:hypothetical protein
VPAGLLKGAIQGTAGIFGDVELLYYGVRELLKRGANESMLDAFVRGLEENTILPTTDDVKRWLDENVRPLVPEGADPRRVEAARTAEFVGELGAMGELATRATKGVAQSARQIGQEMATTAPAGQVRLMSDPLPIDKVQRSKNYKTWSEGSDIKTDTGKPRVLYHATTHDFDTFSLESGNPENHYGKAFYLTDSIEDANANYAGIGPDLKIRIEQRTERLADELMDMTPEDVADFARELNVDESLIDLAKIEESGASPELIREMATKELTTHGGVVMPVFAKMKNPIKVGTTDETKFSIETEFDDAGDIVSESGNGIDLYNSLSNVGRQYDIQVGEVWQKISDEMLDGDITAGRVDEIIRNNVYDIYTPDGEFAGPGQFIADVFRDMGFDGIEMNAEKYFGPRQLGMGARVAGMEGVKGAKHYILFEPTSIKSAVGNRGTFDLKDPNILRGGVAATPAVPAAMQEEETK